MTYWQIVLMSAIAFFVPLLMPPEPVTGAERVQQWWRNRQQRQQYTPPATRIDDPEEPIENSMLDYVWGDNANEAATRCRNIAARYGLTYLKVKRTSQRGRKWECHVLYNHPEPTTDTRRRQR